MLRSAKIGPSSFNPEPTAAAYLRDAVAVGSGLNEPNSTARGVVDSGPLAFDNPSRHWKAELKLRDGSMENAEMSTVLAGAERRVVLPNVSWQTYLALLDDVARHGGGRLTYDRGVLEIMSPSLEHESSKTLIGRTIEAYTEERGIDVTSGGSTTFKRDDLLRGVEPDECYFVQQAAAVRDKGEIDLHVDPAPDLAVEVDITKSSLDKLGICAALGITEVWRYDGLTTRIYVLGKDRQYRAAKRSTVLPDFPLDELNRLLANRREMSETELVRSFRRYVRQRLPVASDANGSTPSQ